MDLPQALTEIERLRAVLAVLTQARLVHNEHCPRPAPAP